MRASSPRAELAPGPSACRWRWSVRAAPVEAALGPIALAAVRLFTEGDFRASGNAAATPAAGCSTTRARTTAAGGAKWRSAAIAPSSGGSRRGGAGGLSGRLAVRLMVLLAAALLAGCSPALETDQARLCRMALPALMPEEARIAILSQTPDPDGRGLERRLHRRDARRGAQDASRRLPLSRAGTAARVARSDLARPSTAERFPRPSSSFSSATGSRRRRAATPIPRPLGDLSRRAGRAARLAYGLQMALDGLPLGVDLRAARGRLFADLWPDRADQFRLRRNGRGGRLCGGDRGDRLARLASRAACWRRPSCWRPRSPRLGLRVGARGLHSAEPRAGPAGAGGDASAWRCSCRSSCASPRATGRAG